MMSKRIFLRKARGFFMQSCHMLLFVALMALIFHLTFNVVGKILSDLLAQGIDAASALSAHILLKAGAPAGLTALLLDGIFPGVGSVLSFVPVIGVLFFFLSLLQESGCLARVAAMMDGPMRRIGLSGQAIIPMVMGFGCNVPAIMTAGSLLKGRERLTVTMMIPFLSCSARLPIYGLFIPAFFPDHRLPVISILYLLGIFTAVLAALLQKKIFGTTPDRSVPRFTRTSFRTAAENIFRAVLQNCAAFIKKAFTVILLASVIVWFFRTFDAGLTPAIDPEDCLLACFGKAAAPVFEPLGFGNWQAVSALISGIFAKEAVVSTLAVLSTSGPDASAAIPAGPAAAMLADAFTPLSAFCFMSFCLLYIPCIAAFAAARQILGTKKAVLLAIVQMMTAWMVSFLLFQTGSLIMQV